MKNRFNIKSKQKSKWVTLRAATTMILCRHDCISHYTLYPLTQVMKLFWSWVTLEEFFSILMSDFREASWKNNADPKEAWLKYIRQGSQRQEMINFLTNDFPLCTWSLRMLDRRLIILTYFSMMVLLSRSSDEGTMHKKIKALKY